MFLIGQKLIVDNIRGNSYLGNNSKGMYQYIGKTGVVKAFRSETMPRYDYELEMEDGSCIGFLESELKSIM